MKTQNELILEKLIELGLETTGGLYRNTDNMYQLKRTFDAIKNADDFLLVLNSLVSECGKRGWNVKITYENEIVVEEGIDGFIKFIVTPYTRQNICAAFCKVTGIEI
jgi:hypothetical protein